MEGTQGSGPMEGEALITRVNKAVTAITTRIQTLASSDGADSKVSMVPGESMLVRFSSFLINRF